MKKWNVLASRILHETTWNRVKVDTVMVDGEEFEYSYTERVDEGPLIIPEQEKRVLWMVRQYRHPIRKRVWQFPAEGRHEGESWEAAAQRGIREEIDHEAEALIDLGIYYPDPGGLQQKSHYFLARGLKQLKNPDRYQRDEMEELETGVFAWEEILTLVADGKICDGWTLSALFVYQRFLEQE